MPVFGASMCMKRAEAAGLFRSLIERIELTPNAEVRLNPKRMTAAWRIAIADTPTYPVAITAAGQPTELVVGHRWATSPA